MTRPTPPASLIRCLRLAAVLSLTGIAGTADAKPENITDAEMKVLPRYCPDTMGFKYGDAYYNTSPRARYWVSQMGKGFWAMHHYCWAQININRARRAGVPAQTRQALRESARGDYGYVINNTAPDFIMLPEIYTRLGEVELLLARPEKASQAFARARELKPDYWPAYSHWAEYLKARGKNAEAMQIVRSGLAHSPESRVLRELYRVLGGTAAAFPKPESEKETAKEKVPPEPIRAEEAPDGPPSPEQPLEASR